MMMEKRKQDLPIHRTTARASKVTDHPAAEDASPTPREAIGLELAANGDPLGAAKFLSWVERELQMMLVSDMPRAIEARLRQVYSEVSGAAEYVRGFVACSKPEGDL